MLDINKLKAKLEQLNNPRGNRIKRPLWSPSKDGTESQIRMLQSGSEDPFYELHFHYNVGNRSFLCPKYNEGKDCPICEFVSNLYRTGEANDKKVANEIRAKQRFYVTVVDRADAEMKPKLWGFGITVYKELLAYLTKEDYKDCMSTDAGLDLFVQSNKAEGAQFATTGLVFARKETPLTKSAKTTAEIVNAIPDINDVFPPVASAQLQEGLNSWLKLSESDAEEASGEVVKGGKVPAVQDDEDYLSTSEQSIDDALNDALA